MSHKKPILLLCAAMLCAATYAHPDPPEGTQIPVVRGTTPANSEIPKGPIQVPIDCVYYSDGSTIGVVFQENLGYVSVEIVNQTTGEYTQTTINSADGSAICPISGNPGFWTITFSLSDGTMYYGEFEI